MKPLLKGDLPSDPIELLKTWREEAKDEVEPDAMCLSTVGDSGRPSGRMVLLRGLDLHGLTFFTNYLSRKGSTKYWKLAAAQVIKQRFFPRWSRKCIPWKSSSHSAKPLASDWPH